jgi:hypothetical protein
MQSLKKTLKIDADIYTLLYTLDFPFIAFVFFRKLEKVYPNSDSYYVG